MMKDRLSKYMDGDTVLKIEERTGMDIGEMMTVEDFINFLIEGIAARNTRIELMADDSAQLANELAAYEERVRSHSEQLGVLNERIRRLEAGTAVAERANAWLRTRLSAAYRVLAESEIDRAINRSAEEMMDLIGEQQAVDILGKEEQ